MLRSFIYWCVGVSVLCAVNANAVDCFDVDYYDKHRRYFDGEWVQRNGVAYRCKVEGWCNQAGAYLPGVGWAWKQAWERVGSCACGSNYDDVSYKRFAVGQYYEVGDVVFHRGRFYECQVDGWCSGGYAYEPGVGRAWYQAWRSVSTEF